MLCGNDVLAFGALFEAQTLGLAVYQSLSVIGFDDLELARHLQPALTTAQIPAEAMWGAAAERLISALPGEPAPRAVEVQVPLVVRESTGPAPRR